MRVLVIGAGGMLGHKLVQVLAPEPGLEVHGAVRATRRPFEASRVTWHTGIDCGPGADILLPLLERLRPDVVVNAVGAIKQKDLHGSLHETLHLNALLPHLLAWSGAARVIHFSTDCVFTGERGNYRAADVPDATDLYGRSKALGEIAYGPHLTLRTSVIGFELGGYLSLLSWLFRQPRGSTLRGWVHATFSGLPSVVLSRIVRDLIVGENGPSGVHHVASEPISKYHLLTRLNEAFDLGHTIIPDERVRIDRSLDDGEFRALTGTIRPAWDHLIEELRADVETHPYVRPYHEIRERSRVLQA